MMTIHERRYDIDWLRVIAIGLLLIYHISIVFQPWGVLIGFIQNDQPLDGLWKPMTMINIWRIPLLFFVSGMGVGFAIRKRSWKQLLTERARRILVPFAFGALFIVPIHILIWQKYYHQDVFWHPHAGHLWFLANIFIYVVVLMPVFFYLKRNKNALLNRWLEKLYSHPTGLLPVTAMFIIEAVVVNPEIYEFYALNLHGFLLGLLAFFFGFSFILNGNTFARTVSAWRWYYLVAALAVYFIRYFVFDLKAPVYLMAIESNVWIFALLGFAYRYLNRPGRVLDYLREAAYPVYIIHMIFLYLGSYLIMPADIPAGYKFLLLVVFTFSGCYIAFDLIIRRINFLRPVFGLKPDPQKHRIPVIKVSIFLIPVLLLLNSGCRSDIIVGYEYHPPRDTGDGLVTGSLVEAGIDSRRIEKAVTEILRGRFREVHALLILKADQLVLEEYFSGHRWQWDATGHHGAEVNWDRTMPHHIMSATKSVTSACIGIAIDRGYIGNAGQSIFEYLPGHRQMARDGKERITIEHLLTMTSGLAWREWSAPYSSAENPAIGIWFQDKDPVSYILGQPLISEPGTEFNYSTGNMILLGEILRNASGMTIDAFSAKYLFNPLSIDTANWALKFPDGVDSNNLMITPRAMVKIGDLFLHHGVWKGHRIIPDSWVDKSATAFGNNRGINVPGEPSGKQGYAYGWWTKNYHIRGKQVDMFIASGFGGQHIMVIPSLEAVVVFTGGNYVTRRPPFRILERYLLPAMF